MPEVTAMIPVLSGSSRVPDKNLLLVNGRVLSFYTIEACRESRAFEEIYLNSEDGVFADIAKQEGVRFYRRPPEWGGRACLQKTKSRDCGGQRCVINDHYLYNFMTEGTDAEYVCQVNTTSPLLTGATIRAFVKELTGGGYDSLFATEAVRAESFYRGEAVTHSRKFKKPSNEIEPLHVVCWAIAGWRRRAFIEAYERDDINEDGPVFCGNCGLFPIDKREALDIDTWPTLELAADILKARQSAGQREWKYIDGRSIRPDEMPG